MRTAVERGSGLNSSQMERYEPVSLCVQCDEAVAHEVQKRRERSDRHMRSIGWVVGGFFLTVMFRPAPIPWPVALIGAGLLAWWGILGRCIFALYLTVDTAYLTLGKAFVDHYHTHLVLVTLALVVAAKFGWQLRNSQDRQNTKKTPILLPQTKQGNP